MSQDVNLTIQDGALSGGALPSVAKTVAVIGCSSTGPTGAGAYADVPTIRTLYGEGPLVEHAAELINDNGNAVILLRVPTTTSGSAGSVSHAGTGTSTMSVSGTSNDYYDAIVQVTTAGTVGTSFGLKYSLDAGRHYSPAIAMGTAASYAVPRTGLTLAFTSGTGANSAVAGDTYSFIASEPLWQVADITGTGKAIDSLKNGSNEFGAIHVLGKCARADVDSIDTAMTGLESAKDYVWALTSARDHTAGESDIAWMTAIESEYASFSSKRTLVAAGAENVVSPIDGRAVRRSIAWPSMSRAMAVNPGVDLARVKDGPLPGTSAGPNPKSTDTEIYHDERIISGLDAAGFVCARTIRGRTGIFLANANIMAGATSDFTLLQYRRVMDEVCRTTRNVMLDELSNDVRLGDNGFILDKDALSIEGKLTQALKSAVVNTGDASSVSAAVSRTDDLSATKTMHVTVSVLPKGYLKDIEVTLSYINPALNLVSA